MGHVIVTTPIFGGWFVTPNTPCLATQKLRLGPWILVMPCDPLPLVQSLALIKAVNLCITKHGNVYSSIYAQFHKRRFIKDWLHTWSHDDLRENLLKLPCTKSVTETKGKQITTDIWCHVIIKTPQWATNLTARNSLQRHVWWTLMYEYIHVSYRTTEYCHLVIVK